MDSVMQLVDAAGQALAVLAVGGYALWIVRRWRNVREVCRLTLRRAPSPNCARR